MGDYAWPEYKQGNFKPILKEYPFDDIESAREDYMDSLQHILSARETFDVKAAFDAGWLAKESSLNGSDSHKVEWETVCWCIAFAFIVLGYVLVEAMKLI